MSSTLIIILLISIPLISITLTLFFMNIFIIKPMKRLIDEQSRYTLHLFNKVNRMSDDTYETKQTLSTIQENITSLTSSIDATMKEYKRSNNQTYLPTPDLANMITATIKEQIETEFTLSKNMSVPRRDSFEIICNNVHRTYPYIEQEYIIKRCSALLEKFMPKDN